MTPYMTKSGREVYLTPGMEQALMAALSDLNVVKGRSVQGLINRGLATYLAAAPTLTEDGVNVAGKVLQAHTDYPDPLEGEPAPVRRPEYRFDPAMTEHDRVITTGATVGFKSPYVHGTWTVIGVADGVATLSRGMGSWPVDRLVRHG